MQLDVPDHARAKLFEPLIETTWKIFLNAHAYCFEDFQIPNDHHHFSVLFLELFSKTVYEKWYFNTCVHRIFSNNHIAVMRILEYTVHFMQD